MSDEIAKVLDLLAERFGTTVEHLWQVMVVQSYIAAIYNLIGLVVGIVFILFVIKRMPYWIEAEKDGEDFRALQIIFSVAFCVGLVLYYGMAGIAIIITGIFNPEYLALQKILELLQ